MQTGPKNFKTLKSNEYKRLQLIEHQLFTADVDIKSWLRSCIFCQMLRFQSDSFNVMSGGIDMVSDS